MAARRPGRLESTLLYLLCPPKSSVQPGRANRRLWLTTALTQWDSNNTTTTK